MLPILATAALLTSGTTAALLPLLRRGLVDLPNHRSSHSKPIPRGAGAAVVVSLVTAAFVLTRNRADQFITVVLLALAMTCLGFCDDLRGLRASVRLVATSAVSAVVVAVCSSVGNAAIGAAIVILLTGYTNAFNFMDGINGISGLNAIVCGLWYAVLAADGKNTEVQALCVALVGASIGFLPFNLPNARVFLGDSGSYGLGFLIGSLALWLQSVGVAIPLLLAPLLVYLLDTSFALTKRMLRRARWTDAHREHVYQRLVDAGWSHFRVSVTSALFAASCCLVGLLYTAASQPLVLLLWVVPLSGYLALPLIQRRLYRESTALARD